MISNVIEFVTYLGSSFAHVLHTLGAIFIGLLVRLKRYFDARKAFLWDSIPLYPSKEVFRNIDDACPLIYDQSCSGDLAR